MKAWIIIVAMVMFFLFLLFNKVIVISGNIRVDKVVPKECKVDR